MIFELILQVRIDGGHYSIKENLRERGEKIS